MVQKYLYMIQQRLVHQISQCYIVWKPAAVPSTLLKSGQNVNVLSFSLVVLETFSAVAPPSPTFPSLPKKKTTYYSSFLYHCVMKSCLAFSTTYNILTNVSDPWLTFRLLQQLQHKKKYEMAGYSILKWQIKLFRTATLRIRYLAIISLAKGH